MKILLAVDGSEYTRRMLAWLATHEEMLAPGADYNVVTVSRPLSAHVARHLSQDIIDGCHRDRAEEVLAPVVRFARHHGWRFETQAPVGDPAETIARTATEGRFHLVVMGSHGHSAVGSLLLGSVVQRVLASCKVPVLIVR